MTTATTSAVQHQTLPPPPADAESQNAMHTDSGSNDDDKSSASESLPVVSPQLAILKSMAAAEKKEKRPRLNIDMNARVQSVLRICKSLKSASIRSGKKPFHDVEKEHGIRKGTATRHGKIARKLLETFDVDDITEQIARSAIIDEQASTGKPGRRPESILNDDEANYIVELVQANLTISVGQICLQFQQKFGKKPQRQRLSRLLRDRGLQKQRLEARKTMTKTEKSEQRKKDKRDKLLADAAAVAAGETVDNDDADDEDDDATETSGSSSSDDDKKEVPATKKAKKSMIVKDKVPMQQILYDAMLSDERGFDHAAFDKRPATRAKRDVSIKLDGGGSGKKKTKKQNKE